MKKKIFIFLIVIFLSHFFFRVYSYKDAYLSHFDHEYWKDRYLKSQWVVPNSKDAIGDDGLYAHVGWEYIHGRDPTSINAEIPPLGKYMIGLSEVIFDNQNIFALFSGIFVLSLFFILNVITFKNKFIAFLPVFIFSFDPLFYTQLRAPFLDLFYLGLLLLVFIFFLRKKFLLSSVFLGLMVATKASASTFLLVSLTMVFYLLFMKHRKVIKNFFIYLPISCIVFIFTYAVFFFQGHTIKEFLGVQKWILNFYTMGAKGDPLNALQIISTGMWSTWWGQQEFVSEWSLLWPISLLLTVYSMYVMISKRKLENASLFAIWIVLYLIFLSFVPVWPRYLLLVLPFMYNLSVWVFSKRIVKFSSR